MIDIPNDLAGARSRAIDALEDVAGRLTGTREAVSELVSTVGALASLFSNDDMDLFDELAASLSDLASIAAQVRGAVATKEARAAAFEEKSEASTAITQIARNGPQLLAISSMTEIAAVGVGANMFGPFVVGLRKMALELEEEAGAVGKALDALDSAGPILDSAISDAASLLEAALSTVEKIRHGELAESKRTTDEARRHSIACADDVQGRASELMSDLIRGIQFSDQFAQRSNNIMPLIIGSEAERGPNLAQRHCNALVDDAEAVSANIDVSLSELRDLLRTARDFTEHNVAGTAVEAFDQQEHCLRAALEAHDAVREKVDLAARAMNDVDAARAGLGARFKALSDAANTIKLSSLNADNLSRQSGRAEQSLSVLADAVRQVASDVIKKLESCDKSIEHIMSGLADLNLDELQAATGRLSDAISKCHSSAERRRSARNELPTIRSGVQEAVEQVEGETETAALANKRALAAIATFGSYRFPEADGDASQSARDAAWARYTMQREREIHLEAYPSDRAAEEKEVPDDAGEIEFF